MNPHYLCDLCKVHFQRKAQRDLVLPNADKRAADNSAHLLQKGPESPLDKIRRESFPEVILVKILKVDDQVIRMPKSEQQPGVSESDVAAGFRVAGYPFHQVALQLCENGIKLVRLVHAR